MRPAKILVSDAIALLFYSWCGSSVAFRLALEEVKLLQKQREKKAGMPALTTAPQHSPTGHGAAFRKGSASSGGGSGSGSGDKGDGDGGKEDLVLQDTFAQETAVTVEDPNMYVLFF